MIPTRCSVIFGEFRRISEGVAFVPAVYQFLSVEQKSKVIFVPRSFLVFFTMKVRNSCLYLMKRGDRV